MINHENDCVLAPRWDLEKLNELVFLPGNFICEKCNFILIKSTLYTLNGIMTSDNELGDTCPNCETILRRMTWKEAYSDIYKICENQINRSAALASLCAELYQACGAYDMPDRVLDQLSAAMRGEALPHETILPVVQPTDTNQSESIANFNSNFKRMSRFVEGAAKDKPETIVPFSFHFKAEENGNE